MRYPCNAHWWCHLPVAGCSECIAERGAKAGAWWLGLLGFALAAPAATEHAAIEVYLELADHVAAEVIRGLKR